MVQKSPIKIMDKLNILKVSPITGEFNSNTSFCLLSSLIPKNILNN